MDDFITIAKNLFQNTRTIAEAVNCARKYLEERGWTRGCLSEDEWIKDPTHTMHPPDNFTPSYLHYDIYEALRVEVLERQAPKQLTLF